MKLTPNSYSIFFLKIIAVLFVLYWISSRTFDQYSHQDLLIYQQEYFELSPKLIWLVLILLIMPLNWLCESKKWKLSLSHLFTLSNVHALKSVFAGVALGIFTPNRIGEFAGRLLTIPEQFRAEGLFSNALCSLAQFITTLSFGILALLIVLPEYIPTEYHIYSQLMRGLCLILILVLLLFYYRSTLILNRVSRIKWLRKLINKPEFQINLPVSILNRVLLISIIRYVIFGLQYIIVLDYFDLPVFTFTFIVHIAIVYLTVTIVPSLALSKLGVREGVAILILGNLANNDLGLISATFILWIINIAIPGIIGSIVLLFESKWNSLKW